MSLPFDAYGCEFSGIVLESSRLHDPSFEDKSVPSRVLLEATTAHEVAHKWFYGIVGSDQLLEPWLDEGIAQYATLLYYQDRYGEAGARGYFGSFEERWERVGRAPLFLKTMSDRMGARSFR